MQLTMDELAEAQDLDLGQSDWLLIDQDRINAFADSTEDRQWIHIDPERAASSPFGSTIAHGYLVLSLIPKLFFELVSFKDAALIVNYGIDKLRFLSPVAVGSEISLKAKITSVTPRSGGLLFRVRGDIRLRDKKRALVVETLFLAQTPSAG